MSTPFTTLDLAIEGAVARIWLNRPELRNAFNDEVIARTGGDAFSQASSPSATRSAVIVLGGQRPGLLRRRRPQLDEAARPATRATRTWPTPPPSRDMLRRWSTESPKPTIARVQGDVYAGGTGLVAACDVAVSADTRLATASARSSSA
jgi:methylglutaconyl-CoA hydratase